jgi:uncharacterized protein with FMN-binding domain
MKKLLLSVSVIVLFGAYSLFGQKTDTTGASPTAADATTPSNSTNPTGVAATATTNGVTTGSTSTGSTTGTVATSTTTNSTSASAYKDGTYTGTSFDAYYGNVQVKAVISGGKITDVVFLSYPKSHGESVQINNRAMPKLKAEAISAQSSKVNAVSGATLTSQAFIKSLASALTQAKS